MEPDRVRRHAKDVMSFSQSKPVMKAISKAHLYTFEGRTLTLEQWSKEIGVAAPTLAFRIKAGWPPDRVFAEIGWKLYEFNGRAQLLKQWAAELGIAANTICQRISAGWPLERVFSSGRQWGKKRTITFQGETLTVAQWAARLGITDGQLRRRIQKGWPLEQALTASRNGHAINCMTNSLPSIPSLRRGRHYARVRVIRIAGGRHSNFLTAKGTGPGGIAQDRGEMGFTK
jgi:hypothetical protein